MALSKSWTAKKAFDVVRGQLRTVDDIHHVQRFERMNLAQYAVASQFYALMENSYRTTKIIQKDNSGVYGNGTWTVLSRVITLTTQNTNFVNSDVGKVVVFRIGPDIYIALVESVLDANRVKVQGAPLPTANGTIDEFMMVATTLSEDTLSLATLDPPLMRTGQQVNIEIWSSVTSAVDAVSIEDLRMFRPTSPTNLNRIVFALDGEDILFAKGGALSSLGTLILRYPRVPIALTSDNQYWDIPDGPPMALALLFLTKLLAPSIDKEKYQAEAAALVQSIFTLFGVQANLQEVKKKVEALT
jgi:hypothetical protein